MGSQPWYRSLNRSQWNTLIAANLGWLFDGYETYALVISVGVALRQLLDPSQYPQIPFYAGTVIALTLLGWGIGGLIGGVIADYLGRKRTMMLAILAYSIMTGLSAFAWDWFSFAVLRFLVGVAIGSEWVTGTSIVAELWPDRNARQGRRADADAGSASDSSWPRSPGCSSARWARMPGAYMFLLGVLPALLTLWMRRSIPESETLGARQRAAPGCASSASAAAPRSSAQEQALARFTVADLFAEPEIRRRVILAFLMSLATTFAFWGISAWLPPYVAASPPRPACRPQQWASYAAMANNGARHPRLCRVRLPRRRLSAASR